MSKLRRPETPEEVTKAMDEAQQDQEYSFRPFEGDFSKFVSTGSTLIDLAISGGRRYEGGIPGGILVEIFGPSSSGKTAILAEAAAYAQAKGSEIHFQDTEARLDKAYSKIYGLGINEDNYSRPETVEAMFEFIKNWDPRIAPEVPALLATDSLAALSTELELDSGDKMGMKRAKEFSQGLRTVCHKIRNSNWLVIATNQTRQGQYGETTPGGNAIGFYSSLRMKVRPAKGNDKFIEKTTNFHGKQQKKIIGIRSEVEIIKSSVNDPHRTAPIYILFGYGIDNITANLQWLKTVKNDSTYITPDGQSYKALRHAVKRVEDDDLESKLEEETRRVWHELEEKLSDSRKPKRR